MVVPGKPFKSGLMFVSKRDFQASNLGKAPSLKIRIGSEVHAGTSTVVYYEH